MINDLHDGIAEAAGDWRTWALLGFGFVAFLIQQLSLATGQLAPAMAAVSVANPAVSVVLGILLFEERLTRPGWHVVVAGAALLAALGGAMLITLANRETPMPGGADGRRTTLAPTRRSLIIEILVLALASTVRPTSLAAVSAILSHDSRRRLLLAYVSRGFGLHLRLRGGRRRRISRNPPHPRQRSDEGIADIVGGVVALLFGCAVLTGRIHRRPDHDAPGTGIDWKSRLDRRLTVPAAAIAGPLTHIPGFFYLIALNVIVAHNPRLPGGLLAVGIYDAIWFALPLAALATCTVNPDAARHAVASVHRWTGQHSRALLLVTSFTVGVALVIRGALSV